MGYSALYAGFVLAPASLLMLLLSPVSGKLAGRYGPRLFMSLGPFVSGLGLLALIRLQPGSNFVTVLLPTVGLFGLGLVLTVAPLTDEA